MALKLRFDMLSIRLLVRSSVSNPLIIENYKAIIKTDSKSKVINVYNDFVSLEVHPSFKQAINRVVLPR